MVETSNNSRSRVPLDEVFIVAVWLAGAGWCAWVSRADGYFLPRTVLICQVSGYLTLLFLAVSLLIGPFLRVATWFRLQVNPQVSFRIARNTGIASGLAAVLHAAIALTTYLSGHWRTVLIVPYLQWGGLSLLLFVVLLIGSLKPLMSLVRWQLWKPLFRLSLAAAAAAFFHILNAPFSSTIWTVGLFAAGATVYLLRLVPASKPDA